MCVLLCLVYCDFLLFYFRVFDSLAVGGGCLTVQGDSFELAVFVRKFISLPGDGKYFCEDCLSQHPVHTLCCEPIDHMAELEARPV